MIGERVALLVGLFLVPAYLVWLGHGLRDRTPRQRSAFWGGVIGHAAAMVVTLGAMMAPPIWWHDGGMLRDAAVHWTLILGVLIGAGVAVALHRRGG